MKVIAAALGLLCVIGSARAQTYATGTAGEAAIAAEVQGATAAAADRARAEKWRGIAPVEQARDAAFTVKTKGDADKLANAATIEPTLRELSGQRSWEAIEITEAAANSYSAQLWYREDAMIDRGEPRRDAEAIVRAILKALVASGAKPASQSINVFVSAMQHTTGETGTRRVLWFGNASYNYNSDSVDYDACTGKGWLSPC